MSAAVGERASCAAIGLLTSAIGALIMARRVGDPVRPDRILRVARERLTRSMAVGGQEKGLYSA